MYDEIPFRGHHPEQTISAVVIDILKIKRYTPLIIGHEPVQVAVNKIKKNPEKKNSILEALSLALNLEIQRVDVYFSVKGTSTIKTIAVRFHIFNPN